MSKPPKPKPSGNAPATPPRKPKHAFGRFKVPRKARVKGFNDFPNCYEDPDLK